MRIPVLIGQVVAPAALLTLVCALSLAVGARAVPLDGVLSALGAFLHDPAGAAHNGDIQTAAVISRIPRTVTALVVGPALAVAGLALQGATRNPLGDSRLLGLSSGAALATAIGLALGAAGNLPVIMMLAVVGTLGAAVIVYAVAAAVGRSASTTGRGVPTPLSLTLAGAAVSAGAASGTTALLILFPFALERFRYWAVGTVGRTSIPDSLMGAVPIILMILLVILMAPGLDALALGDDLAHGLGARPGRVRALLLLAAVILTAVATALAGPIGFVGLMVPHILRRLGSPSTRMLAVGCTLWGALLVVSADLLGRWVIEPQEIHVGVATVILGVPMLLFLLRRRVLIR